jgi:hypothetical protein
LNDGQARASIDTGMVMDPKAPSRPPPPPSATRIHMSAQVRMFLTRGDVLRIEPGGNSDILAIEARRAGISLSALEVPAFLVADVSTRPADGGSVFLELRGCFRELHAHGDQTGSDLTVGPLSAQAAETAAGQLRQVLGLPRTFVSVAGLDALLGSPGRRWIETTADFAAGHGEMPDFDGTALIFPRHSAVETLGTARARLWVRGCLVVAPRATRPFPGMARQHRLLVLDWRRVDG